jgi:hypothetical protein
MRIGLMGAAIGLLLLVGACGGLIGPQSVANLFGIDGVVVALEAPAVEVGAQALLPAGTSFAGTISETFTGEGFDVPGFVNATLMEESVLIEADVLVSVPAGEDATLLPATFSLVSGAITLEVSVDGTEIAEASGTADFDPALVLTRRPCGATSCPYTAAVSAADHAIVVTATAADANAVFDAMQEGKTLVVTGTYAVTVAPGLTRSAIVSVTLNTAGGTIEF